MRVMDDSLCKGCARQMGNSSQKTLLIEHCSECTKRRCSNSLIHLQSHSIESSEDEAKAGRKNK